MVVWRDKAKMAISKTAAAAVWAKRQRSPPVPTWPKIVMGGLALAICVSLLTVGTTERAGSAARVGVLHGLTRTYERIPLELTYIYEY